jgi:hypothetical protein
MRFLLIISLILLLPLNPLYAQNWSEPVAVTSGLGDDHHVDAGYLNSRDSLLIAWDRTVNGNTDIYARILNLQTGTSGDEIRLTSGIVDDDNPSILAEYCYGIFYRSDEHNRSAIYYTSYDGQSFSDPWLTLYSDVDIYEPTVRINGASIPHPTVLCRSDSAVLYQEYNYWGPEPGVAHYIAQSGDYPVYSYDGYWIGSMVPGGGFLRRAWETEINDRYEIDFIYNVYEWTGGHISGFIPNDNYNYHNPSARWNNLYFERE